MKKILLLVVSFFVGACIHQTSVTSEREPAQASIFSTQRMQILNDLQKDADVCQSSKHASRLLDHGARTEKAILIMHGLHESPAYMSGFSKYFYDKGYNVLNLRLPGHLTKNPNEINHVKAEQWIESAEKAFAQVQALGEKVEILGYSTGGALGTYLAFKYPDEVKALYLVAPALALSNRVFLTSQTIGWTGVDLGRFCKRAKLQSWKCRTIFWADGQFEQMVQEGLVSSPAAGFQVQRLINRINEEFGPKKLEADLSDKNYFQRLRETYLQLKVPMVMVNSEIDTVVAAKFNQSLMRDYQGPHNSIFFSKKLNITHVMLPKSRDDAFERSPETANPYFGQILDVIESLHP